MLSFDKTIRYGADPVAVVRRRGLVWAAGAVLFAALTAAGARLAVPLPGTAVPFTLQVLAVLLSGFLLGPFVGAASQIVYLAAGLAGAPVFYNIPNTTNSCDGSFAHWKQKVKIHRGLRKDRRNKMINYLLNNP